MKELKVFIASSINEFAFERSYIGNHVRKLNDKLIDKGLWLRREMCEDESNALSLQGKQNEYNELIKDCDVFFMMIGNNVGKFTEEEYDVAIDSYKEKGKPEIHIFFKDIPDEDKNESVSKFNNRIQNNKNNLNMKVFNDVNEICHVLDNKAEEFDNTSVLEDKTDFKEVNIIININKDELTQERYELGSYIDTLNNQFRLNGIYFQLQFRDDIDLGENEIGNKLCSSDLFYLVFSKTAESQIEKDFDIALEKFKETNKSPKIYTYFQSLPENESATESVKKFMDRLGNEIGHYYSFFEHIDSVKLNMILELSKSQSLKDRVNISNGEVCMDGNSILSLENVPVYKMNDELQRRKKNLNSLKDKKRELAFKYAENSDDIVVFNELSDVNKEIEKIEESLHDMEMTILDMCSRIADYNSSGKPITDRQKLASMFLDKGDYKNALAALDMVEIRKNIKRLDERKEKDKQQYALHINEYWDRINILKSNGINKENLFEIKECYEEAVRIAKENKVGLDVMYSYITFLYNQNDFDTAIEYAKKLETAYNDIEEKDEYKLSKLFNIYGLIYNKNNNFSKAEEHFLKAIEINEKLATTNPSASERNLAANYNNIASLYINTNKFDLALEYYKKAIGVNEGLARTYPFTFEPNLAANYNNIASLYNDTNKYDLAEEFHLKAIEIRERLAQTNPSAFEVDLAASYNNIALLYNNTNKFGLAEDFHLKTIEIKERLAKTNPSAFEADLAASYNNIALLYNNTNKFDLALEYYLKAIEIRERFSKTNPSAFEPDLVRGYNNIASLYNDTNKYDLAEEFHLKAIEIGERLATINPSAFEPDLVRGYNNIALLYNNTNKFDLALEYYKKAIEINEGLAKTNPFTFEPNLATNYNNIALLYSDTSKFDLALEYYLKAIEIREKLAKNNPSAFEPNLAGSYNNIASLYNDTNKFDLAEEFHLKAIEIKERLAKNNPSAFEPSLAGSYNNIALLYSDTNKFDLALEYYLKAIEIKERLAKNNPSAFEPSLARSYNNITSLYNDTNKFDLALEYCLKATEIMERLAKINPPAFEPKLARCYDNITLLYNKLNKPDLAKEYKLKAIKIKEKQRDKSD